VRHLLADRDDTFPVGIGPGIVVDKPVVAGDPRSADGKPNLNSEFGGGFTSVERGWNLRWQTLELRRYDRLSGYVWTELYDVEHEMAGLYSADRALKDTGGSIPADTNADTVLVPEISPIAPGKDVVAASNGSVEFDVRVSHHGTAEIEGDIVSVWGAQLGSVDREALVRASGSLAGKASASPFLLGEPVHVSTILPDGWAAGRLHLALVSEGAVSALTAVDVVR
jgi:hypothetical protein